MASSAPVHEVDEPTILVPTAHMRHDPVAGTHRGAWSPVRLEMQSAVRDSDQEREQDYKFVGHGKNIIDCRFGENLKTERGSRERACGRGTAMLYELPCQH